MRIAYHLGIFPIALPLRLPGISGPTANASANTIASWLGSQDWLRLAFFQLGFSYNINYIKTLTVFFFLNLSDSLPNPFLGTDIKIR